MQNIEKIAQEFITEENERQQEQKTIYQEKKGTLDFDLEDGSHFRLTARADRIDQLHDNRYVLYDYKTGKISSAKEIDSGLDNQLYLTALILLVI